MIVDLFFYNDSTGFEELEKYFTAIFTTNSVKEDSFYANSESVKLFNVF